MNIIEKLYAGKTLTNMNGNALRMVTATWGGIRVGR